MFIDGFYADGISASLVQMPGLPAGTYALSVYVPIPADYDGRAYQASVLLVSGAIFYANPAYSVVRSQPGLALSVGQ